MTSAEVIAEVRAAALKHGIDPDLLVAVASKESNFRALAVRDEPAWRYYYQLDSFAIRHGISRATEAALQRMSYGPLQVMGSVARELGFNEHLPKLFVDPRVSIDFGARKLKQCLAKYESVPAALAAYNAGTPRRIGGRFTNQSYVDDVLARVQR